MADDSTQKTRVSIGGMEYTLRGQASEMHLRAVARAVDGLMHQIASANPRLDERRIAVLTAVNFADEFIRLREAYQELQGKYDDVMQLLDEQTRITRGPSQSSGGV
ncbi:cell division protein ZapA [Alicyclobacillus curvatus]|jgi:cell division protein ZapA|nr:cell division protein ZapA [Alicyclobacillus curvatus]